ncbi:MAG: prepilin-type N-terminal cleavage/methylation domain-containing protein, partial [Bacilli bacterium]
MKNNKGFTLTEVIVTISIVAILMIIAIPSINNVMKNSRDQISSMTKKNIEESAKLFGQEVYMCDRSSDIISVLN